MYLALTHGQFNPICLYSGIVLQCSSSFHCLHSLSWCVHRQQLCCSSAFLSQCHSGRAALVGALKVGSTGRWSAELTETVSSDFGDWSFNRWAGSAPLSGFWKVYKPWPDLTHILGVYKCVLLSELHPCGEFGCVVSTNGFACCLLVDNVLLRPWSKSFRTRGTLKVRCVMLFPRLAEFPAETLLCSAAIPRQFASSLPTLDGMVCSPLSTARYKAVAVVASSKRIWKIELTSGCLAATGTCLVWPCCINLADLRPVEFLQDLTWSQLMAGFAGLGLSAETLVQELVWLLYIWKAAYKKNLCCSFLFMYGISHIAWASKLLAGIWTTCRKKPYRGFINAK